MINYDLPWNPMRIVQRHGRVDRIGSQHDYVHLGLFFPAERLDDLLGLEARLQDKLALADAAVGAGEVLPGAAPAIRSILLMTRSPLSSSSFSKLEDPAPPSPAKSTAAASMGRSAPTQQPGQRSLLCRTDQAAGSRTPQSMATATSSASASGTARSRGSATFRSMRTGLSPTMAPETPEFQRILSSLCASRTLATRVPLDG